MLFVQFGQWGPTLNWQPGFHTLRTEQPEETQVPHNNAFERPSRSYNRIWCTAMS